GDMIKRTITIIEGWTLEDIAEYLKVEELDPSLEGYLFPDTYELSYDDGINEIIEKILVNFDKKTKGKFGKRPDLEIIIKASLLEKEVRSLEDKKMVAGVLKNRLEAGMLLQVDAAMITYEIKGLPSRPICNPGLESMEAAIYPTENDYLYYISTPEGETIFSKTFKEHNAAVNKYLR
ncbi:endolytic transglycosylase MltG, partial [Patescibacteria group bacterium]|nr:endolytic transglycosylase MltG [Patescibacteria group bacterium]